MPKRSFAVLAASSFFLLACTPFEKGTDATEGVGVDAGTDGSSSSSPQPPPRAQCQPATKSDSFERTTLPGNLWQLVGASSRVTMETSEEQAEDQQRSLRIAVTSGAANTETWLQTGLSGGCVDVSLALNISESVTDQLLLFDVVGDAGSGQRRELLGTMRGATLEIAEQTQGRGGADYVKLGSIPLTTKTFSTIRLIYSVQPKPELSIELNGTSIKLDIAPTKPATSLTQFQVGAIFGTTSTAGVVFVDDVILR